MSDAPRSLVRNAADPEQVKLATRKDRDRERIRAEFYAAVLGTYEGRFVMWDILTQCRMFETISVQNSMIYTLSGRRDVGLELYATLAEASDDDTETMRREARQRVKRLESETDAAHTARAGKQGDSGNG